MFQLVNVGKLLLIAAPVTFRFVVYKAGHRCVSDDDLAVRHRRNRVLIGTEPHLVVDGVGRQSVYQIKLSAVDLQLKMGGQIAQKVENLRPLALVEFIEPFQRRAVAVSVPVMDIFFRRVGRDFRGGLCRT